MALWAIPAGHLRAGRGLARVGGVACQRTSPVRVIRAALKPCITPRLGPDVLLAGKPRLVAKLHRPWPGGVVSPARANSSLVPRNAETTALPPTMPAVRMWTRPSDRAASCGACGQGMDKCCALAHPLPTLAALAPTSSPLLQQRLMGKATAPTGSRIAPSSQAIRLRNKPANSHGGSTRKCEKQQWVEVQYLHKTLPRHAPASSALVQPLLPLPGHCVSQPYQCACITGDSVIGIMTP